MAHKRVRVCRKVPGKKRKICYWRGSGRGGPKRRCEKTFYVCETKGGNLRARTKQWAKKRCKRRGKVLAFTRVEAKKDFRLRHGEGPLVSIFG